MSEYADYIYELRHEAYIAGEPDPTVPQVWQRYYQIHGVKPVKDEEAAGFALCDYFDKLSKEMEVNGERVGSENS